MKNLVSKIFLVGLFLLPLPAFSSLANKFNAKRSCTKETANYERLGGGSYFCVKGNKVTWAWNPNLPSSSNQILEEFNSGRVGKMVQKGTNLNEFAIEGQLLVLYTCRGSWGKCSGPIYRWEVAKKIDKCSVEYQGYNEKC